MKVWNGQWTLRAAGTSSQSRTQARNKRSMRAQ